MHRLLLSALLVAGCSSKSASTGSTPSAKCDAYAERYAMLIDPDPARKEAALGGARSACEKGRVTEDQIRCIDDASSQNAARACMGLTPIAAPREKPALSKIEITSVEGEGITDGASAGRQKMWRDQLEDYLELCERKAVPEGAPRAFDVVATFGSGYRGKVDGAAIPEPLRECISDAIASGKPDGTTRIGYNTPITFHLTAQPAP